MAKSATGTPASRGRTDPPDAPALPRAPLRALLNAFPDACLVVAGDGAIREFNDPADRLFKLWGSSLSGLSLLDLADPAVREKTAVALTRCCAGKERQRFETTLFLRSGAPISVYLSFSALADVDPPECLVVIQDITEAKRRDLDLLRFSNLAHHTVNPIEITDPQGRIIYINPAFEKVSGYSKEEMLGQNPKLFGSGKHPKSFWSNMWQTINAGNVWVGEVENRRRNGEPFFTHLLISPIIDNDGTIVGYFGVHRDITEQKNLQQQLIHAQKMESIGLLAAGIAHEVGNPLTSISSLVQVIQRTTHDDFTQEKLELIKSQITRISRIIRDLVDFSRRSSYEVQLTDINKGLREAVEIVRVGKKSKEIAFEVELEDNVPPLPLVPDQVEQVFINILINAVDAIHEEKARSGKQGKITVHSSATDESVVITIADNGTGISDKAMTKIFEPFYTTKRVGEGTGLGLWVSYGIIKSFNGTIQVSSEQGVGTTFTITFPLAST